MAKQAKLGANGPVVNRIGYGAMVLEGLYGSANDEGSIQTLRHVFDGQMMVDTSDAYGNGHNEMLIARAKRDYQGPPPFIATKFGIVADETEANGSVATGWGFSIPVNGTPGYVEKSLERSLNRLEVEQIDLWYAHFSDPNTPIEDTVAAMASGVAAGKVAHIGLSNPSVDEVRRAHAVHPIAAVQYEFSMWRREAELELLPVLKDLGIALVGWSPLGAGFLTGAVETIVDGDFRNNIPAYSSENFSSNRDRFAPMHRLAADLGISPAQLALAWCLQRGEQIFVIPGSRNPARVDENAAAAEIVLDDSVMAAIDEMAPAGITHGGALL